LRLPFFKPKISEKLRLENPEKTRTDYMVLYGKETSDNVQVGKNCVDLDNTGDFENPLEFIQVKNLSPNHKYNFACLAFDCSK